MRNETPIQRAYAIGADLACKEAGVGIDFLEGVISRAPIGAGITAGALAGSSYEDSPLLGGLAGAALGGATGKLISSNLVGKIAPKMEAAAQSALSRTLRDSKDLKLLQEQKDSVQRGLSEAVRKINHKKTYWWDSIIGTPPKNVQIADLTHEANSELSRIDSLKNALETRLRAESQDALDRDIRIAKGRSYLGTAGTMSSLGAGVDHLIDMEYDNPINPLD